MHYCCVKLCGRNTKTSSIQKDGISFHRFPKCPKIKELWIDATNRPPDWFPSPSSVICSRHFKSECFKLTKSNRRMLFPNAVPMLHLPSVVLCKDSGFSGSSNTIIPMATNAAPSIPTTEVSRTDNRDLENPHSIPSVTNVAPFMSTTEDISMELAVPSTSSTTTTGYKVIPDKNTELLETLSNFSTPRKKRLRMTVIDLSQKLKQKQIKIKRLQTTKRTLQKKVCTLQSLLKDLEEKKILNDEHISILKHTGVQSSEIIKRQMANARSGKISRTKYSPELRSFALTLNFYSSKAYQYVRKTFNTCLPSPKTLSKWYKTVDGRPGFTKEAFNALKLKSEHLQRKLYGTLIFDEINIKHDDLDYTPHNGKTTGYVDFGGELETDCMEECTEALVFLVVPFNACFKVPIGYFLTNKLKAEQKATLIRQAIRMCKEVDFEIKALTFDGCITNLSTVKKLGCVLDPQNLKTTFNVDENEITIFIDPVHMVKLIRNSFEFYRDLKDGKGNCIKWQHIEKLHELQEKETFHMANKLRSAHINFKKNIMKVKLATQIFSTSVATALLFCSSELKIYEFADVQGTVDMLMVLNDIFDILDSKTHGYGFKRALNKENFPKVCQRMDEAKHYLMSLHVHENSKNPEKGVQLIESRRFTGYVGLCVCIESAKVLFKNLVENENCPITYLPLHKVSQDHIELFFCNVRSAGGCNDNPTPRQLEGIYKKMLIHTELQPSGTGNCVPLENISILNCSSAVDRINITTERTNNNAQLSLEDNTEEDDLVMELQQSSLSLFAENIIEYIAGFVVKSLTKRIKCNKCVQALVSLKEKRNSLIFARDKGGLIYPSDTVIKVCRRCEVVIRSNDSYKTVKPDRRAIFFTTKALRSCANEDLFPDLLQHQFDNESANHVIELVKSVIEKYINVRLAYLTKKSKPQSAVRRIYTKLIHFKGQ